ncbi:MAG: hypothetical protein ACK4M7_09005 [Burkholderiales bacterium]
MFSWTTLMANFAATFICSASSFEVLLSIESYPANRTQNCRGFPGYKNIL